MNSIKGILPTLRRWSINNRLKNVGSLSQAEIPKFSPEQFELISITKILKNQEAFKKLRQDNQVIENVSLSGYNNALSVGISEVGTYKIWADVPSSLLYLFSPHSGTYSYYYNKDQDQWSNTKDDHFMEDLMTRELLRFCKGYLDL